MHAECFRYTGTGHCREGLLGSRCAVVAAYAVLLLGLLDPTGALASPDTGDTSTPITHGGSGFAPTLGSYKTGIVEANGSYFVSHRDAEQRIVIVQSRDRGQSWVELFRSNEPGPQAAALATDDAGRVYAVFSTWGAPGRFLRFDPLEETVVFHSSFDSADQFDEWTPNTNGALLPEPLWVLSNNVAPGGGSHSLRLADLSRTGVSFRHPLPDAVARECAQRDCELRYWVKTSGGDGSGYGAYVATFGNTHGGFLQTTPTDWIHRSVALPPVSSGDRQIFVYLQTPGMAANFDEIEIVAAEAPGTYELAVDVNRGQAHSKFSLAYNPVYNLLHWSRRVDSGDMEVVTLDPDGNIVLRRTIALSVNESGPGYWDAQYHSVSVDPWGSLHLLYNPHYWPDDSDPSVFERVAVLYLRSDDAGDTWGLSDGTPVATPFAANEFETGGELISIGENAYLVNLLTTDISVHIIYWVSGSDMKTVYVRLNRATGEEQQRLTIPTRYHSILIDDPETDLLYLAGEGRDGQPSLYRSADLGDTWSRVKVFDQQPNGSSWNFSSAFPQLASSRFVIVATSDVYDGGSADAWFLRYDTSATAQ